MSATLYHAPLTCSLAARFAAAEAGVELNIEPLNFKTKELLKGGSLFDVNPLGQVSTLKLSDGQLLTETATCILWLQSQSQNSEFKIEPGSAEFFQLSRWLGFCATELHKQIFRVVFYPEATEEVKDKVRGLAPLRFEVLEKHLANNTYLLGDKFSAADAYLSWFFVLAKTAKVDPSGYPSLERYRQQVLSRPLIQKLIAEDLEQDKAIGQNLAQL